MTTRVARALVTLAVSVLAVFGSPGVAPPTVVAATSAQDDTGRSLSLAARSPWVGADDVLRIDVATEGPVDPLLARLHIHAPVDSMEELEESLDGDVGRIVYRMPALPVGWLTAQADGTRRLEIGISSTTAGPLTARLRSPGIYPVTVTFEDEAGEVVDVIRTPVVRLGTEDDPLVAPDLALVVALAAPPSIGVGGRQELADADLERLSRLADLLDAEGSAGPADLTVAASPDTIEAITASADPRATAVLEALARSTDGRTVVGSPYVPLDAGALASAGLGSFVEPILDAGRSVLADRVAADLDTTTWIAPEGIAPEGAELLGRFGLRHAVVPAPPATGDASPAVERTLVDAGPVDIPGTEALDAVLVDTRTTEALTARAAGRADAGHVALAELLLRDGGSGSTVAVFVGEVADDSVLAELLPLLAEDEAPVRAVPLDPDALAASAEEDDEDDDGRPDIAEDPVPVPAAEDAEALTELAPAVRAVSVAVETFAGLVGAESARAGDLRLQLATSLAAGIDADRRSRLVDSVAGTVESTFDGISIAGQTDLNLTARRGTLPLVIRNENPFPVEVVLRIRSERLRFPEGDRFELLVEDEILRFDVPVGARATGSVPTFVEVLAPNERVTLDSRTLDVRSTAVSGVGLAISLGALLVLVVWWVRTWRRSRRDIPEAEA